MSKRLVLIILFMIFSLNLVAIVSISLNKKDKNDNEIKIVDNDNDNDNDNDDGDNKDKDEDNGNGNGNGNDEDIIDAPEKSNNTEQEGSLTGEGAFVKKVEAEGVNPDQKALDKSILNQKLMNISGGWKATNYAYGDITSASWTVQKGDTLWELAEARYGNRRKWTNILDQNRSNIGRLPSGQWKGQKALIVPGQRLTLPLL